MAKWRDVKQNRLQEKKIESIEKSPKSGLSSLSARFKAFITDSFLIAMPIIYIVIYLVMGSGKEFEQNMASGWSIILIIHSLIILIFWLKNGQTPGLKAYEGKLVDNNTRQRVSVIQVIIRYVATTFAIISFFLLFIPFFNKERKTFQDIISNTIIINFK